MLKEKLNMLAFFAFLIGLIIIVPFAVIWAWNTLFGSVLMLPYNFYSWLSVLILHAFFNGKVAYEKKND